LHSHFKRCASILLGEKMLYCEDWIQYKEGVSADIIEQEKRDYVTYIYCTEGEATFLYGGASYKLRKGSLLIYLERYLISDFHPSPEFKCNLIHIARKFLVAMSPRVGFGIRAILILHDNPVLDLTEEEQKLYCKDIQEVLFRINDMSHPSRYEVIATATLLMLFDTYKFGHRLYGSVSTNSTTNRLVDQFVNMLMRGDYRKHRDITYYANELCISSKYLSEACRQVSGHPANYWITRFCAVDIHMLLRTTNLTMAQICSNYGFSSTGYLTRFCQNYLGASPRSIRAGMKK